MPRRSRRQLLLDIALDRFGEQGFDGTSVGELAAEAGVSKAAVSYHFPSKDDLLVELADPMVRELEALVPDGGVSWPEGVHDLLAAYLQLLLDNREIAVWLDGDRGVVGQTAVGARLRRANRAIRRALVGGQVTPRSRIAGHTALGALWRPVRSPDHDEVVDHTDLVLASAMAPIRMVREDAGPTG